MNNLKNTYSIILPTFNEAGHIKKLILEIYEIFLLSNHLFEIIIIDDNSQDGTSEIVHEISKSNDKVILKVRKNKKGSLVESLNDGIQLSQYENLIWMDADSGHIKNNSNPFFSAFFLYSSTTCLTIDRNSVSHIIKSKVPDCILDKSRISFNTTVKLSTLASIILKCSLYSSGKFSSLLKKSMIPEIPFIGVLNS